MHDLPDLDEAEGSPITTRRLVLLAGRAMEMPENARPTGGAPSGQFDVVDARAFISRARLDPGAPVFTIAEKASRRPIGAAAVAPMTDHPTRPELSLFVDPRDWGRGYGTEAAQAVIDRFFRARIGDTLWAVTRVTNEAARRVMEKCGFQVRERGMARSVALRGAVPVERFGLERRTWISLKSWGVTHGDGAQIPAA